MLRREAAAAATVHAVERRPFRIINALNGKCMEIHGGRVAGCHVVSGTPRGAEATYQLWYLDPQGIIHSMISDFVLDSKNLGDKLIVNQHRPGDLSQMWHLEGDRLVNREHPDRCAQIRLGEDREGADIILHHYDRKPFQHWRLVHV